MYDPETRDINHDKVQEWYSFFGLTKENNFEKSIIIGNGLVTFRPLYRPRAHKSLIQRDKTTGTKYFYPAIYASFTPICFPFDGSWGCVSGSEILSPGLFISEDDAIYHFRLNTPAYKCDDVEFTPDIKSHSYKYSGDIDGLRYILPLSDSTKFNYQEDQDVLKAFTIKVNSKGGKISLGRRIQIEWCNSLDSYQYFVIPGFIGSLRYPMYQVTRRETGDERAVYKQIKQWGSFKITVTKPRLIFHIAPLYEDFNHYPSYDVSVAQYLP